MEIKTLQPTKVNKVSRSIVNGISFIKTTLKVPERHSIIRLKDHEALYGKKSLTKSIVTELKTYKGVQTISVKTDIHFRCLCKL